MLDQALPARGIERGSLVEWLGAGSGSGATSLALIAAREAQRDGGTVVVVDRSATFYPVAAAGWGLSLASMILLRPASDRDAEWALDQALRCAHVAAAIAWPQRLDGRAFRRLQLAAEESGAVGLLIRPLAAQREPSWADVRLAVRPRASPASRRLSVELVRARGRLAFQGRTIELEIDESTGDVHEPRSGDLAAEMARAAANVGTA